MKKRINIDEPLTVKELAHLLDVPDTQVIKHLFHELELMRTVNQIVEIEAAKSVAIAFGFDVES